MKKTILEEILVTEHVKGTEPHPITGVVVGILVDLGASGELLVDFPGNEAGNPIPAKSTARFSAKDTGCEIALLFENGDAGNPLVIGPMVRPGMPGPVEPGIGSSDQEPQKLDVSVDGETVTFSAEKEIVLRCGASSITLTRAGKILIRGKYLLSRSSGVNRIKGGSIQLN